jgi:hypothetical protein
MYGQWNNLLHVGFVPENAHMYAQNIKELGGVLCDREHTTQNMFE